jgi:hypothetical protein
VARCRLILDLRALPLVRPWLGADVLLAPDPLELDRGSAGKDEAVAGLVDESSCLQVGDRVLDDE